MYISKLKNTYPVADPALYLIGKWDELDPIFAGRLAMLAKEYRVKIKMTEGYRSTERQAELYNQYLNYKKTGKGNIKSAAKPGSSWHEYRLAVDTSTQPIRGMSSIQLQKCGLCKPIKSEGWHIQPIETQGQTDKKRFEPIWQEDAEMAEQTYKTLNDVPSWGKATVKKLIEKGGITPTENNTPQIDDDEINITHSMLRIYVSLDKIGRL